ncbi:hypothetical protein EKJ_26410 [Qipengyuania flava]|uniref:Putative endonuclease Z1 domain-containing protein n=1 Tax=Qipengyuania flava TaxID=192812 RepID=A0A3T1CLA1_9SPHN|nr:Z1 domain-containing protein [Qipengyuania flava]BBI21794.1 hypothetical protein EKJ_26410 [Qipengyuania flava]
MPKSNEQVANLVEWEDLLDASFASMTPVPISLENSVKGNAIMRGLDPKKFPLAELHVHLDAAGPNDRLIRIFRKFVNHWDYLDEQDWMEGTVSGSQQRRQALYEVLGIDEELCQAIDKSFPTSPIQNPTIIAEEHEKWYTDDVEEKHRYYFDKYLEQLTEKQKFPEKSAAALRTASREIVSRLSDPTREEAYQTKGLVVGYVQSGKTANFAGVIARAADAGYRLIIVLAGTLNILRDQTQFRLDRDVVGLELVDDDYDGAANTDKFLKHGAPPSQLGFFDWQRLTGPKYDYRELKRGIDALEFERREVSRPFFHPENLYKSKARLVVIKKHPSIMRKVISDLKKIKSKLEDIPTLIIDDESDQASINTLRPTLADTQKRTATNKKIVELLALLPRAQYVGYTATPYANVFINPTDAEDLFPKDYVLSLPKPDGYMGPQEFLKSYTDDDKETFSSGTHPHVRAVKGEDDDEDNLQRAIDTYLLAGALKLYREQENKDLKFRHHTMLVHHSPFTVVHDEVAALVEETISMGGYRSGPGLKRLKELFESDFRIVSQKEAPDLPFPSNFEQLKDHIGACYARVFADGGPLIILNGNYKDDEPDFEVQDVWKIVVGGAKLSRGYTIEGLTVSYFRRTSSVADTMMQFGRWFGYRTGYQDLVRLYIGVAEKFGDTTLNLYEAFSAMALDELDFRRELERYADHDAGITPRQIPPLVSSHLLLPTAKNKMFNARLEYENLGGKYLEKGVAPAIGPQQKNNSTQFSTFLENCDFGDGLRSLEFDGSTYEAFVAVSPKSDVVSLFSSLKWPTTRESPVGTLIEFLKSENIDPEINDFAIIVPQLVKAPQGIIDIGDHKFSVAHRARVDTTRYGVFSEPRHRPVADYISHRIDKGEPGESVRELRRRRRGAILIYPVIDKNGEFDGQDNLKDKVTFGFAFHLPKNSHRGTPAKFGVREPTKGDQIVVQNLGN